MRGLDKRFKPWAQYLLDTARYNNIRVRITSGYRSVAEQRRLYERYIAGRQPYPVAPPGRSYHNYGLAVDIVADSPPGAQEALGRLWESWGGLWGGSRDPVHFSIRRGV